MPRAQVPAMAKSSPMARGSEARFLTVFRKRIWTVEGAPLSPSPEVPGVDPPLAFCWRPLTWTAGRAPGVDLGVNLVAGPSGDQGVDLRVDLGFDLGVFDCACEG